MTGGKPMINWVAAALMTCFGIYYFLNKKPHRQRALVCKALATAMPGILLIWHVAAESTVSGPTAAELRLTLTAILFYMAADVLLECRFVLGAVSFAAGHLCMAAGMIVSGDSVIVLKETGRWTVSGNLIAWTFAAFLIFSASAVTALRQYLVHLKKKKLFYPAASYVTVLSIMAALAVASGIGTGGIRGLIPAVGGICFVVSDILLGRNRLGKKRSPVIGAVVLILYYLSVYLLAMRVWG